MRKIHFADSLERHVAESLKKKGVEFIHESEGAELDFFLPDYKLHIEVKRFSSDRTTRQLRDRTDVILIQGKEAAEGFAKLIE